ncbi:MAG: DNA repair protein RecO [Planctomycetota bacterium]|nr:DNA repair protein RecO [Planctomycetota bacterium]
MAVYKSQVLILKCQDWSETSQVVHLLAREAGRLRSLAKGSRRGLNPFSGPLDRWVLGEAVFSVADPDRLATLMELYETERFEGLRRHLPAFYGASYATELVMALVPDLDPQPAAFDLVVRTFRLLAQVEPEACRAVTFAFAWRLLALLGYMAEGGRCVECQAPVAADQPANYSAGLGGPLCANCRPEGRTHHLTAKTAQAMAFLASAEWDEVPRVRLSQTTANQMRSVLAARVAELAGKELSASRYV